MTSYTGPRVPLVMKLDTPDAAYPQEACSVLFGALVAAVLIMFFGASRGSISV